jgi:hypothetical protein
VGNDGDDGRMATKRLKTNGTAYNEAVVKQLESLVVVLEQNIDDQALEIEELSVELEALSQKMAMLELNARPYTPPYTLWEKRGNSYQQSSFQPYSAPAAALPSWYKRMLKKVGL